MNRSFCLILVISLCLCHAARSQTYPVGFSGTDLATGLSAPTSFCIAQDGTIYVCLQSGTMRVWKEGTGLLPTQFFANNPLTVNASGERGLLGVAVDPNFLNNRFIYVYYTAITPAVHNRISRFTASANGELAIGGSEAILLDLNDLSAIFHNGGALHFGPDGRIYAAIGDNAVHSNSQSNASLLGKMLRINPTPGDVIPTDNPTSFPGIAGSPTGNNRAIWAVGLRNPFTFAFHPVSGRMFINDVGSNVSEEINDGFPARNYGWSSTEGSFDPGTFPNFTLPFYAYPHSGGAVTGFAITGGAFYVPQISPYPADYYGDYFFADNVSNWIKRTETTTAAVTDFAFNASGVVDLRIDAGGRLVYVARGLSRLVRVNYATPFAPSFTVQPVDRSTCTGDTIQLAASVAGNPTISFVWRHDRVDLSDGGNITGSTTPTLTISNAQAADAGQYELFIQNASGNATSDSVSLTVYAGVAFDGSQIQPFVNAVMAQATAPPDICWFDFNGDNVVNLLDVDGLVSALLAQ